MTESASEQDVNNGLGRIRLTVLGFSLDVAYTLTQLMLGGVVVSAIIIANVGNPSSSYTQHIVLCTFGYFILMAEAILVFSHYGWAHQLFYELKRRVHLTMQLIGSVFVITGTIIRMVDVSYNFSTCHGIFGFLAMLLNICTFLGGLLSLLFPKLTTNKLMIILHACLGATTLLFAFIAIIIAFHNYFRILAGDLNANTAIALSVFSMVGTLLTAAMKNYKRIFDK